MSIGLADLRAQYAALRVEIDAAVAEVLRDGVFVGGPRVGRFEAEFASFCGAAHAVGVGNGTDGLALALRACGVGRGDEVVTSPLTFAATAEAIGMAGATPVFADVEPETLTLSPGALEAVVGPRTRAVVPVHLYGRIADMDPILRLARGRGLVVVEDACQAHGASYRGRRAGTLGDAAAFSFFPGKNLGAYGDAGAVVTQDAERAAAVRMLRDHGRVGKHDHAVEGVNSRLDALQAAILSVKLKHLDSWNRARAELARLYGEELAGLDEVRLPAPAPAAAEGLSHVWHLYVVRARGRDGLLDWLARDGIQAGVHYPTPLHRLRAFRALGLEEGAFPAAEAAAREVLSLPLHPEMTAEQVHRVCRRVRAYYGRRPA